MTVNVRLRNGMAPSGGSGGVSEGDLRGDVSDLIDSQGVVDLSGGHLLVHEKGTPGMGVVVDEGVGYIPNTAFDENDSDSIKFWEAVISGTTASRTLVISANSSGSTRIDLICLTIDPGTTPNSTASNVATLQVVAGTPGAGAPSTPTYSLVLAQVTVANGATEILNANIADTRTQIAIKNSLLPTNFYSKYVVDPSDNTKRIAFDVSGATTGKTATIKASPTVDRTITLPNATTTLVGKDTTDVLANKSIEDTTSKFVNASDNSKVLKTDLSGATASKTMTIASPHTDNRTITLPDASTTLVGRDTTDTLTNKRNTKRVSSTASSSTPTPNADTDDAYLITALAAGATFGAPTGTPTDSQPLLIRIKDNGTARTLAFNAAYRFSSEVPAPSTTVISKTMYLGFVYNSADSKWDCLAVLNNF